MLFSPLDVAVDLSAIQHDVTALLASQWVPHVNQRDYAGDWSVLPLRCPVDHKNAHPVLQSFAIQTSDQWVNLPALTYSVNLLDWLNSLQCTIRSVRLMRLAAGGVIKPHQDPGLTWEDGEARLHLPVFSNPNVKFFVGDHQVPMTEGGLWYINAGETHHVTNAGTSDRINLVMDVWVNNWLLDRMRNFTRENVYSRPITL